MIPHFASACAWVFKRFESAQAKAFLQAMLENGRLAPGAALVISSYLSVAQVTAETKVVTVISIYDGQIPIMAAGARPLAEDALHRKISQFDDLYSINNKIDWSLIFIDDGDDRRVAGRNCQERTSRIIQRELAARYPMSLDEGRFRVIELEDEVRASLASVQGAAIVYGMYEALRSGADFVFYSNIDLDSHVGLQGSLLGAMTEGEVQIAVGSNRLRGSYLRAPLSYFVYSVLLNRFVRLALPVGKVLDTHNSFKGFRRESLRKILPMTPSGAFDKDMDYFFSFPDMLLARACVLGLSIREIPVAMHRTAPLQFSSSLRYGLRYYRSVWNQRRHLKAWERHGGRPVNTLAVRGLIRGRGLTTIELEDPETLEMERAFEHISRDEDTDDVLGKLAGLFERVADAPLTFKRLAVLRKSLSASLKRPDRERVAASLGLMLDAGLLNDTVRPFVSSFLAIFKATESTLLVTTVLALGRAEDAIRPEYLETKIEQLTDLFSVNPSSRWRLIVVGEARPGVPLAHWDAVAQAKYGDLLSRGQLRFLRAPAQNVWPRAWAKGGSVLLGMAHAVKDGADFVIFTDAKPAIDLGQEGWLLEHVARHGYEVAVGSRYLRQSRTIRCAKRRFTSLLYNLAVRTVLPHLADIRDTQCGFKCFSAQALEWLLGNEETAAPGEVRDKGLSFDTELLGGTVLLGGRVAEVPIVSVWSHAESWRLKEGFSMLMGLAQQRRRLTPMKYLADGKSACVYVSQDGRKVIKVLRTVRPRRGLASVRTRQGRPHLLIERACRWALRYSSVVELAKWSQRGTLPKRMFLRAMSLARGAVDIDLEVITRASAALPGDIVPRFTVQPGRWCVLPGRFGRKTLRQVTAIEQEAVPDSLEDRLAAVVLSGDIRAGKRLIDKALETQVGLWRHGYFNCDPNVLSDTRLDRHGKAVFVDLSDLTSDRTAALGALTTLAESPAQLFSVLSLKRLSPSLAIYYNDRFSRVFTAETLMENWYAGARNESTGGR